MRFVFGSAEERGKAQSKIAALILAGVLIVAVPSIAQDLVAEPSEITGEMHNDVQLLINGLQWLGGAVLTIGFIWAGIVLKFNPKEIHVKQKFRAKREA